MSSVIADAAVTIGRSFELSIVAKAAAALMLGLMLAAVARRARASVRHLLLASAFAGVLALPAVAMLVPVVVLEMPGSFAPGTALQDNIAREVALLPRIDDAASPATDVDRGISMAWPDVLRVVWAGGTALLLFSLAIALWRLLRIARYGVPWFNPLTWIALRRLCLEAERACDDLSTRVSAVLDTTQRRGRAGRPVVAVAVAAAAAIIFALAPVHAVHGSAGVNAGEQQRRAGSGSRALFRAAERGDVDRIAELLDAGANINAVLDGDGSPLIAAARGQSHAAVRLLLDRGADPNMPVSGDGNPLIAAASEGHVDIVELLLDRGASIDQVVPGDENALIQASGEGHLPVVQLLVNRGANVNARVWAERGATRGDGEWRTPLGMALEGGHDTVVAFLRSSGARD